MTMSAVYVKIGSMERPLDQADGGWVTQQIHQQRLANGAVCVRVRIDTPAVKAALATPGCGSGGSGRPPNADEQRVLALWMKHHLNMADFSGGDLVAFLHELGRVL